MKDKGFKFHGGGKIVLLHLLKGRKLNLAFYLQGLQNCLHAACILVLNVYATAFEQLFKI